MSGLLKSFQRYFFLTIPVFLYIILYGTKSPFFKFDSISFLEG